MKLDSLVKLVEKPYRRIGRGHGSGRVKTSGRGTKGQKARETVGLRFAGSSLQASWLKRLPLLRGKGKNKSRNIKSFGLGISYLNKFKDGSEVTLKSLKEMGIVGREIDKVKILSNGELKVSLTVSLPCSAGAIKKIEKAGGKVNSTDTK